jgi:hypothetical protein
VCSIYIHARRESFNMTKKARKLPVPYLHFYLLILPQLFHSASLMSQIHPTTNIMPRPSIIMPSIHARLIPLSLSLSLYNHKKPISSKLQNGGLINLEELQNNASIIISCLPNKVASQSVACRVSCIMLPQ